MKIISFQVIAQTLDVLIFGLGNDGRVYQFNGTERHWTPLTHNVVNPLVKR